ncbi:MAG: DUF4388 domain-containing protein [Actinomycetota bacterium]
MLNGTIGDITVNDILGLLGKGAKTGRLVVNRLAGTGEVYVRDGHPYYAQSSLSRSLIGVKFIQMGAINATQLRQALDEQTKTGARLGDVLLAQGWVGQEQVDAAVSAQIEDALNDLIDWETGEFTWEPGVEVEAETNLAPRDEAHTDEAPSFEHGESTSYLQGEGYSEGFQSFEPEPQPEPEPEPQGLSLNEVLIMAPDSPEHLDFAEISQEQWRVASLANGVRTVEDIAMLASSDRTKGLSVVEELLELGVLEPRPESYVVEDEEEDVAVDKSIVARELAGLVRLDKNSVSN